jgi:prepilin-type N-terminal cleavage/methylation domain-containing protein
MNTMTAIASRKEKGFTLIELVMVIVILGILAAFALPRFADLGSEARISALNGATGAVKSAAGIAHSACLARAACTTDDTATVDLDGTTINMANAYPEAAAGGPIAALKEGDIIHIDMNKFILEVELSPEELAARMEKVEPFVPDVTGYLKRYAKLVGSASKGAVLD